ncbi:MAG: CocE/NonD family hydrolase [Prochlorotrichaceae cyanobacterium]
MYSVELETRSLLTPDGIRLDADVYFPQGLGEFPVLLMRQPYGRTIASTVVYAHPRWYAQQGYIVVIQDVRGRGTSQGEFHLFAHEVEDGQLTVNWAAELPGSSGAVGMYGFSYQGMTQLYAARGQSPALKTLCPAMLATDLHRDWAYEGGAFCFQLNLAWAIQLAAETARRSGDSEAFAALFQASRQLPVDQPGAPALPEVLQRYAPDSFYFDWVNNPQANAPYWQTLNPDVTGLDLPMLHIGGWFDPYLRGTLKLYQQMKAQSQQPQHLWVGPWPHLPWGQQAGAVHFGQDAQTPIDRLQLRWFDQFLKGKDTGLLTENPVHCFDLGQTTWREAQTYPPTAAQPQHWTLISTGLAAMGTTAGQLIATSSQDPEDFSDLFVHDPWRPVPALGGHAVMPGGSFNRQALDDRADVLTYTSAPLTTPLCLWGDLTLQISVQSPNPSFDLCAVLSVVQGAGVFNFSQGYRRIAQNTPGERITVILELQATCRTIAVGECLRLSFSASSFPAYTLNPGTGDNPEQTPRWQAQVITLEVQSGELQGLVSSVPS